MRFILIFFGLCGLLAGLPPALADTFKAPFEAARTEMNALGNKALAGDASALAALKQAFEVCTPVSDCAMRSADRVRAAAAANNLAWLYWDEALAGDAQRIHGMMFYAKAAELGSPQGAYQSAECIRQKCLVDPGLEGGVFGGFSRPGTDRAHWTKDGYARLELVSALLYQSLNEGLTEAAVARTAVELELAQLASAAHPAGDAVILAKYGHLSNVIGTARKGLETAPTEAQRQKLQADLAAAQPQKSALEGEAAAARARLQAARQAAATPQPQTATAPASSPQPAAAQAPSKGANYETDKSRVRQCMADADALDEWSRDLGDWERDLNRWKDELYEELVTLETGSYGDERADYANLEADQRALNAEKADLRAERSDLRQERNAYSQRCSGSFNANAVDELCAGSSRNDFCESARG